MFNGARILVAPLDWGLGHSTRDIPIIRRLLELDARPVIGADESPLALLRGEFPDLPWARIAGPLVRYAASGSQGKVLADQFPTMLRWVWTEHDITKRIMREQKLDAIISDQRFGVRHRSLPSVLVTHQVFPHIPFAQSLLRRLNRWQVQRFDRCWIMDEEQAPGLAGELSHGDRSPRNARYIGPQSRLTKGTVVSVKHHRIIAVISGPEPQRTMLEAKLTEQLRVVEGDHLLVCGTPKTPSDTTSGNIRKVSHLGAEELNAALHGAEFIISRTGYTSLMDFAALGRTALVIPTPGQPEQEYLGELHQRSGRFIVQAQETLDVRKGIADLAGRVPIAPANSGHALDEALRELSTLITPR